MKIDLIEILACPICKNPDLELIVIEQKSEEIETGLINCSKCNRYYPIKKTIPIMLPDDLRNKEEDKKFLNTHQKEIPSHILKSGKPVSLN
ncbi:MAG: Trm112 family protein [Candidatus Hodarchaeales archaeon]|jgi:uncharacterized protein YbaR (Trm112 family)